MPAGRRVAGVDYAATRSPAAGNRIELGGVDLTDAAQANKAIDAAAAHFGRLDALINIAGGFAYELSPKATRKPGSACMRSTCSPR